MTTTRKAHRSSAARKTRPRLALALAGGGPLGAIYEIGALCALDDSLQGIDFNGCDHYVGVSAGGFIAAGLANGMTPRQLCAAFIENTAEAPDRFDPAELLRGLGLLRNGQLLRAAVARDPGDRQAIFDLAIALHASGKVEEAVDMLLDLFKLDREWNDGAAKAQLFTNFGALNPQDPIVLKGRRRLSSMIFV